MIGLLQRVSEANVAVEGEVIARIGCGIVALVAVERGDDEETVQRLAERLLGFRLFADGAGRMNLNIEQAQGSLLVVPQFTLAADTARGRRPSFGGAADPELGRLLFERLLALLAQSSVTVASGRFGAHMQVTLTNDGPVTFWLRVPPGVLHS
jgi:D-tyrosyl-tRNA(Tyr) deacylase